MLETRIEIKNDKEFTVTESILRHYDNTIVKKPFKKFVEKGTDRVYEGIAYDLKGFEKEYEELDEEVEVEIEEGEKE